MDKSLSKLPEIKTGKLGVLQFVWWQSQTWLSDWTTTITQMQIEISKYIFTIILPKYKFIICKTEKSIKRELTQMAGINW